MMKTSRKILLWAPRLILIVFALFLVIFSFDVFDEGKGAMEIGIAFVAHDIPTLIFVLVVFVAWRREWIGVLSCIMTGPLFIVAAMYAVNWKLRSHAN